MNTYIKFLLQPPLTRNFRKKLKHNFHALVPGEMFIYLFFIRPFWSKNKRFFFEGKLSLLGQMYLSERKALYDLVINYKPRQCFEIGTYTGGGSTFFISSALCKNGSGTLYSSELYPYYYNKAVNFYAKKLPRLNKFIKFIFSGEMKAIDTYVTKYDKVDFVFFDGAEDGKETLEQYRYFEPLFKSGSVIAFHDWYTEKTVAIKPVIEADEKWEKIVSLTPPNSIGFAAFLRQ